MSEPLATFEDVGDGWYAAPGLVAHSCPNSSERVIIAVARAKRDRVCIGCFGRIPEAVFKVESVVSFNQRFRKL